MSALNLQQAIDQAGSPMRLLWKPNSPGWTPPVLPDEYVGWAQEQKASDETVAMADLSHHMTDLFVEGPDALRLLSDYSANGYDNFVVGQAKQFVPVTQEGYLVMDGILLRAAEEKFVLTGQGAAHNWIGYQAERNRYDVSFRLDPPTPFRGGRDPILFRYQIQGPRAHALVEEVFGGPLPKIKFFHSALVTLSGRTFRALRHGMSGQPGYEFIGDWEYGAYVRDTFLRVGDAYGLVQVGAKTYGTNNIDSGWVAAPTPAIFTAAELRDYREHLPAHSSEGKIPINGSYFSENIEDYYVNPFELGYGRFLTFDRDFHGRDGLMRMKENVHTAKVTVVLDRADVDKVFGPDLGYLSTSARHRIEVNGQLIGSTNSTAHLAPYGTVVALALIEDRYAAPGTRVDFVWGEHPGPGTNPEAIAEFPRLRGTVQPAPYNEFARRGYRKNV